MNIWWKIGIFCAIVTIIFSSGMLTEYKFHLASETLSAEKQVVKAQKGQADIIKFNQDVRNADVKDPCFTTKLPDSINKLLR